MAFQAWTFAFTKTSVNEQDFEQDFEKIFQMSPSVHIRTMIASYAP